MNARVRATLATLRISASRMTGNGVIDEENVTNAGFRDMGEYWEVALSELMRISSFIHSFAQHFFEPTLKDGGELYKLELAGAIKFASIARDNDDDAPLVSIHFQEAIVPPRQLVDNLLNMPMRRYLVPQTLKDFIEKRKVRHCPAG
jgi:hypothetical protein